MSTRPTLRDRLAERTPVSLPQHAGVAEWRAAGPEDLDAIWRLQRAADEVDHPESLSPRSAIAETFETSNVDPALDTMIGLSADGELIAHGFCVVAGGHATRVQGYLFGCVHPLWRGRGIGGALFGWQVARSAAQLAEYDLGLPGWSMVYVSAENAALRRLAEAAGLSLQRYFAEMEHPLEEPIEVVDPPEGVRIVHCTEDYYERARQARNDAFRDHWGTQPNTKERWNRLVRGGHFRTGLSFLAVTDEGGKHERVVGFALATVTEPSEDGYIELVGVVRDWRRRGLAPALLTRQLAAHREAGTPRVRLEVDSASPTDANGLYERLGFRTIGMTEAWVREY